MALAIGDLMLEPFSLIPDDMGEDRKFTAGFSGFLSGKEKNKKAPQTWRGGRSAGPEIRRSLLFMYTRLGY